MSEHDSVDIDAERLMQFVANRGDKMLKMASDLAGSNGADSGSTPEIPSLKMVLELVDALGIDPEDKLMLRERILNRGDEIEAVEAAEAAAAQASASAADGVVGFVDYQFALFAVAGVLVLSMFGKRNATPIGVSSYGFVVMRRVAQRIAVVNDDDVEAAMCLHISAHPTDQLSQHKLRRSRVVGRMGSALENLPVEMFAQLVV